MRVSYSEGSVLYRPKNITLVALRLPSSVGFLIEWAFSRLMFAGLTVGRISGGEGAGVGGGVEVESLG